MFWRLIALVVVLLLVPTVEVVEQLGHALEHTLAGEPPSHGAHAADHHAHGHDDHGHEADPDADHVPASWQLPKDVPGHDHSDDEHGCGGLAHSCGSTVLAQLPRLTTVCAPWLNLAVTATVGQVGRERPGTRARVHRPPIV